MIISINDTVADTLTDQPQLRNLYFKLLGLYATVGGGFLVSNVPFFVLRTGEVFYERAPKVQYAVAPPPGPKPYRTLHPWERIERKEYEALDQILLVSHGLVNDRYDEHDREYFERGSTVYSSILDDQSNVFANVPPGKPTDTRKFN